MIEIGDLPDDDDDIVIFSNGDSDDHDDREALDTVANGLERVVGYEKKTNVYTLWSGSQQLKNLIVLIVKTSLDRFILRYSEQSIGYECRKQYT